MDAEFWLQRWQDGAIGFHLDRVSPQLTKYWPTLKLATAARVLVPLCGKSLDMAWLAAQGHQVLGVELSRIAVEQFFEEQQLEPVIHESPLGQHYATERIEIICGDIFGLDAATLESCSGVYDRGAMVALPPETRSHYAQRVYGRLAPGYRGLLLTLEYEQARMPGPPFSVPADEIRALFTDHTRVSELDRMDIIDKEPKFAARGLSQLDSVTWRLDGNT